MLKTILDKKMPKATYEGLKRVKDGRIAIVDVKAYAQKRSFGIDNPNGSNQCAYNSAFQALYRIDCFRELMYMTIQEYQISGRKPSIFFQRLSVFINFHNLRL